MEEIFNYIDYFLHEYQGKQEYLESINGHSIYEWNYEDGCLYLGTEALYTKTKKPEYLQFILDRVDPYINDDGTIISYHMNEYNLDYINAGKIFFFLYDITKNEKYKKASDVLMTQLRFQPRISTGNFWHKLIYPFQVWLDGTYMSFPFYLEYDNRWGDKSSYSDVLNQFNTIRKIMYDEKTGLYYHGYDEYKERKWANPETGLSPNFWLRSIGWYLMALIDCYDLVSEEQYDVKARLAELFREELHHVLPYMDKNSGMFYQLIALPTEKDNYLETSGSLMIAYSIIKGCQTGVLLEDKYLETGKKIFDGVMKQKLYQNVDGEYHLADTCASAGLGPHNERDGSIQYYLSEPVVDDDVKSVGILLMIVARLLSAE